MRCGRRGSVIACMGEVFGKGGLMDSVKVSVLTSLCIDAEGIVTSRNVGVTFDVSEAETHKANAVENEFET